MSRVYPPDCNPSTAFLCELLHPDPHSSGFSWMLAHSSRLETGWGGTGVAMTSQRFTLLSQPRVDDVVLSQPLAESSGLVATDHHVLSVLSAVKNQPKHDILSLHDLHRDNVPE
jgi:hypothetical protein